MQKRVLVKESGQNKKRYVSPTELKRNQALFGILNRKKKSPVSLHENTVSQNGTQSLESQSQSSAFELWQQRQESAEALQSQTVKSSEINPSYSIQQSVSASQSQTVKSSEINPSYSIQQSSEINLNYSMQESVQASQSQTVQDSKLNSNLSKSSSDKQQDTLTQNMEEQPLQKKPRSKNKQIVSPLRDQIAQNFAKLSKQKPKEQNQQIKINEQNLKKKFFNQLDQGKKIPQNPNNRIQTGRAFNPISLETNDAEISQKSSRKAELATQTHSQHLVQQINHLKKLLEVSKIQNLSFIADIKQLKLTQNKIKDQLENINSKNQRDFIQYKQKYEHLTEGYKKAVLANDDLRQQNEVLKLETINAEKKQFFLENKVKILQESLEFNSNQHKKQIKKTVQQWKFQVQKLQKQLRNLPSPQIQAQAVSFKRQQQMLSNYEQQIKYLRNEHVLKIQDFEKVLLKKDKQIKQINNQMIQQQKSFGDKIRSYEIKYKNLQLNLAQIEKDLQYKNIEIQNLKNKNIQQHQIQTQSNKLSQSTFKKFLDLQSSKFSFQNLFLNQNLQINSLKHKIHIHVQESYVLKSEIQELRSQNNNLQQDLNVLQLQYFALQKKQLQSSSTQLFMAKSQLDTALRKQKELESKLQWKNKQIQEKDQFIQAQLLVKNK